MGVVRGGDEHEAAIQRILRAAKAANKRAAIFCRFLHSHCWQYPVFFPIIKIHILKPGSTAHNGYTSTSGPEARLRAEQGFDMVSIITDVAVLGEGMARELDAANGKTEERKPREGY